MSDAYEQAVERVNQVVVSGNAEGLKRTLLELAAVDPDAFVKVASALSTATEPRPICTVGLQFYSTPLEFFHRDGRVYAIVYTDAQWLTKDPHASGTGLELADVQQAVAEARKEHDARIEDLIRQLSNHAQELLQVVGSHSACDQDTKVFASNDLRRGLALLRGALGRSA
ncbi:hypothetical protein [Pseudomonas typographi]|uniref:Uncharacterized protein n=1 Tax=Pseudomonas typographi TaxID=2715964 RepID=A0ABR7ZA13_9PSED|nr:hypothetical protein [Pseudomonas typographi]MBD1602098.1 hypothetical protein [Pseudomonas typographi]